MAPPHRLRAVAEIVNRLMDCPEVDTVYRQAVELCRDLLGVERCAIFVADGDVMRGTYGTDDQGCTTDERVVSVPMVEEWTGPLTSGVRDGPQWSIRETDHSYWQDGRWVGHGFGWVAYTPIQSLGKPPLGVFVNDAAISGTPVDVELQEAVAAVCAALCGIVARKGAEDRVRASESLHRSTIDAIDALIHVVDSDLRILLANRGLSVMAARLGLDVGDPVGRTVFDVFPFLTDSVREEYERVFATAESVASVDLIELGSGTVHTETLKVPVMEGDRVARVLTIVRDVTALRLAEQERRDFEDQVRHAQKLESLGVLAGGIAHDFNNILVGVLGNAAVALSLLPDPSPARAPIEQVERAAIRAGELARQMLAYSGKGRFVVEPVDLTELVDEMTQLLESAISKRANLTRELADGLFPIEGDATQLRQIVLNLITNASDALGEESGTITARTGNIEADAACLASMHLATALEPGPYAYLEVSDTGCGMAPEVLERVFEPFFSTKLAGRGLGMAAVLGIVRGHGGALSVRSAPGDGTTVRVLLPAISGQVATGSAGSRVDLGESAEWQGSGTVLVVDDEEIVRQVAGVVLAMAGFGVLLAEDGVQALEAFREHGGEVVAVLLDLTMPRMGGEETLRALRAMREDLPVVLSSGYDEHELERLAGRGSVGFLQKPYGPEELIAEIREVLS